MLRGKKKTINDKNKKTEYFFLELSQYLKGFGAKQMDLITPVENGTESLSPDEMEIFLYHTPDEMEIILSHDWHKIWHRNQNKYSTAVNQIIDILLTNRFTTKNDGAVVVNREDLIFSILMSFYLDEWLSSIGGELPKNIENAMETFMVEKIKKFLEHIHLERIDEITKNICYLVSMDFKRERKASDNVNDDEFEYGKRIRGIDNETLFFLDSVGILDSVGNDELFDILFNEVLNKNKTHPGQMAIRYLVSRHYAQQHGYHYLLKQPSTAAYSHTAAYSQYIKKKY